MHKIIQERQKVIFDLYSLQMMGECPDVMNINSREQAQKLRWLLSTCMLECTKESFHAIAMRVYDLNTTLFKAECDKQGVNEKAIRMHVDEYVRKFYEDHHAKTIAMLQKGADPFKSALLELIHKIGIVLNTCAPRWLAQVEHNAKFFAALDDAQSYISEHKLYYVDENNQRADRIYALCVDLGSKNERMLSYAEYFAREFAQINKIFDEFFILCQKFKIDENTSAWLNYLKALQNAMMNTEHSTAAWANAERAWMQVKDSWQLGHFLEYYEDNYTHSVALEWDLRINLAKSLDEQTFKEQMRSSMNRIYSRANVPNQNALESMLNNLNRAQMYISTPVLYYAAALNGLFSAQVVPNDELVSKDCGKKIFAFVDFIRAKAINRPKTLLNDYVFSKEIQDFNEEVLHNEKMFKRVYEFTTIGHEGGHMFFMDHDTEQKMNTSGVFKNIEEFKASAGGVFNYLYECPVRGSIKPILEKAVLANIITRAVGLLAYKNEQEIEPYYTEALIFLKILKDAKCIEFNLNPSLQDPLVKINLDAFDEFKKLFCEVYTELARVYLQKQDALIFLNKFAINQGKFKSVDAEICRAQELYEQLYKQYASVKKEQ